MKKSTQEVGVGVMDKKEYVSPEIEVINLDEQPKLLSASVGTRGLTYGEEWSDSEE